MAVHIGPMAADRADQFLDHSRTRFVADLVRAGESPAAAARTADEIAQRVFPNGPAAAGHLLFDVFVDGVVCGHLWLAPPATDTDHAWLIFDVEVDAAHRGQGVGRAVMQAAEHEVRQRQGRAIELQVFGWNAVARGLYESLGYEVVSSQMRKQF